MAWFFFSFFFFLLNPKLDASIVLEIGLVILKLKGFTHTLPIYIECQIVAQEARYSTLLAPSTSHNLPAFHAEAPRPSDDITESKNKVCNEMDVDGLGGKNQGRKTVSRLNFSFDISLCWPIPKLSNYKLVSLLNGLILERGSFLCGGCSWRSVQAGSGLESCGGELIHRTTFLLSLTTLSMYSVYCTPESCTGSWPWSFWMDPVISDRSNVFCFFLA